jgi:hypothetical protein
MIATNPATPERADSEAKKPCSHVASLVNGATLLETIANENGYLQFAKCQHGKIEVIDRMETEKKIWAPDYDLKPFLETGCLFLPSAAWVSSVPTVTLLDEIKTFLLRYLFVPTDWVEPIALYLMMTWVYDRFTAVPYLRFLGEPGTGKTRSLEVCAALAYRGLKISGNITGPALFRSIEMVRGTVALDEADFKDSEEWNDIIKVVNCGYKAGIPVFRCEGFNHTPRPFYVYGPKIISTRQRFEDHATETRCLTFETQEVKIPGHIPYQIPTSFYVDTLALRNKLLRWRFENFHLIDAQAQESRVRDLAPRLGEIGISLCAIAPPGEILNRLIRFLTNYDLESKEGSDKALVTQALEQIGAGLPGGIRTATVGRIAIEANKLAVSLGKPEMTAKRVGGILRSSLGLKPRRTREGFVVDLSPKVAVNV